MRKIVLFTDFLGAASAVPGHDGDLTIGHHTARIFRPKKIAIFFFLPLSLRSPPPTTITTTPFPLIFARTAYQYVISGLAEQIPEKTKNRLKKKEERYRPIWRNYDIGEK